MRNANNNFDRGFDFWLDSSPEYKAKHNPFTEILGGMIKDWPKVTKPEIEELINEKIRYEAQENMQNMS